MPSLWRWTAVLVHALRQALCPSPGLLALLAATRWATCADHLTMGHAAELLSQHASTVF